MSLRSVTTASAPGAIGPYSQAVVADPFVFCSGQVPLDPVTGQLVIGDIETQTERVLENLAAVLEAAGCELKDVVKTTVFLADFNDFSAMNAAYERSFAGHRPARSTVEVSRLPRDARIEIEAIARRP